MLETTIHAVSNERWNKGDWQVLDVFDPDSWVKEPRIRAYKGKGGGVGSGVDVSNLRQLSDMHFSQLDRGIYKPPYMVNISI